MGRRIEEVAGELRVQIGEFLRYALWPSPVKPSLFHQYMWLFRLQRGHISLSRKLCSRASSRWITGRMGRTRGCNFAENDGEVFHRSFSSLVELERLRDVLAAISYMIDAVRFLCLAWGKEIGVQKVSVLGDLPCGCLDRSPR